MRSLIRTVLWLVLAIAVGTLVASVPVVHGYEGRAILAQRVKVDKTASSLFGDGTQYQPIGTPQRVIIDDPKAFIHQDGHALLDDGYLQEHGIYPLQLQTVRYVASLVRIGTAVALLVSAFGLFVLRPRSKL